MVPLPTMVPVMACPRLYRSERRFCRRPCQFSGLPCQSPNRSLDRLLPPGLPAAGRRRFRPAPRKKPRVKQCCEGTFPFCISFMSSNSRAGEHATEIVMLQLNDGDTINPRLSERAGCSVGYALHRSVRQKQPPVLRAFMLAKPGSARVGPGAGPRTPQATRWRGRTPATCRESDPYRGARRCGETAARCDW